MYDKSKNPSEWDWTTLVPAFVHPVRIQIIEAMLWIGQPMSAAELEGVFYGTVGLGSISYHLKTLANASILKCVRTRTVRGATERFFWLTGVKRR